MIIVKGGVAAPKGFLASAVKAGIKKSSRLDLALLYSEVPAVAAGAFTTNRFQASPVKISKAHLRNKTHHAIIVNSGNANCANGKSGDRDASLMAGFIAETLALNKREVLVASTGIIGRPLPIENIRKAVPNLIGDLSEDGGGSFSNAILTTDTKKKEVAVRLKIDNATVTIGGVAKGAGMIYPNLKLEKHATTLSFLTTDASISKRMLEAALDEAVDESFNMISIDGDMSTNDSCFIMANGMAGNRRVESKGGAYKKFLKALKVVMHSLAKEMVQDGEGATKFIEIEVAGADSYSDAKIVARKISTSNLLKCCAYGEDPNWGRVASAAGASGIDFNPDRVDIYLGDELVLSKGMSKRCDRGRLKKIFKMKRIYIKVDLNSGRYKAKAWTSDLSKEYVEMNAEYST